MKYRLPVPVCGVPAESQAFQQGSSLAKTGACLTRTVGIGADGDDFTAAVLIER